MADRECKDRGLEGGETTSVPAKASRFWRAALFFAGSAAFGGLAVALWDRKTLTAMQRKNAEHDPSNHGTNDDY